MIESNEYGGLLPLSIKWSVIAGAVAVGIYVVLNIAALNKAALLSAAFASVFILISRTYWNFRDKQWFLLCSAGFIMVHAILIFVFQVPKISVPALVIVFPVILADFFVILAVYWFVKSRF